MHEATYGLLVNGSGKLRLTSADNSGEEFIETASDAVREGRWYHIAGVIDRVSGKIEIYVDGTTMRLGTVRQADTRSNTGPLMIGLSRFNDASFSTFSGSLDEVRIWNSARTAEQIQGNTNEWLQENESGLDAYYRMDEAGSNAFDPGPLDQQSLRYSWEVSSNNRDVIPAAETTSFSFKPQYSGRYTVTLTVTDPDQEFVIDTAIVDDVQWRRCESNAYRPP